MFNFFRKDDPNAFHNRKLHPKNEGMGITGEIAFAWDDQTRVEKFDVIKLLDKVLKQRGHKLRRQKALTDPATGLVFQPQVASFQPLDYGGVTTTTTIEVSHHERFPDGAFEFQH